MSENLNLTDEQKTKLRPLLEDEVKQMNAVRDDTSLSLPGRRAKIREIRQSTRKQIDGVLTPEQRAKRDQMQEKARERRAAHGGPRGND
jgi:Spy/CpxP family protein refolding chaperone